MRQVDDSSTICYYFYTMKSIARKILLCILALYLTSQFLPGLVFVGGLPTLLFAAIVLTILGYSIKPVLHILSYPFNMITFGLFTFVINGVILWLLTFLVKSTLVRPFVVPGISFFGFVVPKIPIYSIILAYIVIAAVVAGIQAGFTWIMRS